MKPWAMPKRVVPKVPHRVVCWSCGRLERSALPQYWVVHKRTGERIEAPLCPICLDKRPGAAWRLRWHLRELASPDGR